MGIIRIAGGRNLWTGSPSPFSSDGDDCKGHVDAVHIANKIGSAAEQHEPVPDVHPYEVDRQCGLTVGSISDKERRRRPRDSRLGSDAGCQMVHADWSLVYAGGLGSGDSLRF